jgi:hypothetical protein
MDRNFEEGIHEEMLNVLAYKGNANQNDIEIPPQPGQNGYLQEHKQQMLAKMSGKRNASTLLMEM